MASDRAYFCPDMKPLRHFVLFLLVFNSASAIAGGAVLIIQPQGYIIQMPVSMLQYSPFADFLVPGILLFVFNGLFSLLITVAVIKRYPAYPFLVMLQGVISTVWIITEVVMLRAIVWLHYVYGFIGIFLFIAGILLLKSSRQRSQNI